jgi:D-arabinose 1-dehydrogenase-like Zn-dependent alcohol dehydrogenase
MVEADIVWLESPQNITLRKEQLAGPEETQILCATIVSAISPGTELAAWRGLPPLRPQVTYPRLQGYCNVSSVIEVGKAVSDIAPGDRVLSFCSHRSHMLMSSDDVLLKLDMDADADLVACTYLFHLGYNALLRSNVKPGSRVTVVGMGALGLTTVALAHLAGAEVHVVTDHGRPAELALELGADNVLSRASARDLAKVAGNGGADIVVLTTNGWNDWHLAMEAAAPFGTIACLGFPGRGEPMPSFNPLDSSLFYMKQLRIEAVGMSPERNDSRGFLRFNERDNLAWLAAKISEGTLKADLLISGRFDGVDIAKAYDHLERRVGSPVTYILDWNR